MFPEGKSGRCVGFTTLPPSCADCLEIWEPQPPGTLRACPGLQWDCFKLVTLWISIMGKEQVSGSKLHKWPFFLSPTCLTLFYFMPTSKFLNLRPLVFGLTPIGCLPSITLTLNYAIISYWNTFSVLSLLP